MISIIGSLYVNLLFINPLINPSSTNYLNYFIEDRNVASFTKTQHIFTVGYIQDYVIEIDESLLPFESNHVEEGIIIPELFQVVPSYYTAGLYCVFTFRKSS